VLSGSLKFGLGMGLALYAAATLAASFGRSWWLFELVTHFRPHLFLAGVIFTIIFLSGGWRLLAGVAIALAMLNAAPLLSYLTSIATEARAAQSATEARAFRVLTLNLYHRHADMAAVANLIRAEQPDAVLLTELIPGHWPALARLADVLPYRVHAAARGSGNLMLLSRWPVSQPAVHGPVAHANPILEARLCAPEDADNCVTVIGLHASLPFHGKAVWRNQVLDHAARRAKAAGGRVILMGDLNCTPWSPYFEDLLAVGGLADAAKGNGLAATWRSRVPVIGLPIDHVLVGSAITVLGRRVGPDVGSDHLPVIADLAFSRF
jgi:endonuclease/exonuclease/phosphatase (EEP) superfamily protein YafD